MVYLNRIYTKGGDAGQTSLGDGSRVTKTHPRVVAYGGVDELNCVLALVLTAGIPDDVSQVIRRIQNDLFDLGGDLCYPLAATPPGTRQLRITTSQVEALERWIDETSAHLAPLESFILPGGSPAAAHMHHARAVCRRVEIGVVHLAEVESINPQTVIYLNRLSDLLFVLARKLNDFGKSDVLWKPGAGQTP